MIQAAGVDSAPPAGEVYTLTAYRLRTDTTLGLNARGWGAALDTPGVVSADQPFRLRIEIQSPEKPLAEERFQLQYRRNEGDWLPLTAEDFPYPTKELVLDFTTDPGIGLPFHAIQGSAGMLNWQAEDNGEEGYLRLASGESPLLVLGDYRVYWEALEYKAALRLAQHAEAHLLFGYEDADNHYRLAVQGGGPLSLVRRSAGRDTVLDTLDTSVRADQWIEVALVRDGREITVEYEWDPVVQGQEWQIELEQAPPASSTGLYLPEQSKADLRTLEVSAEAHSPPASIVSSPVFAHGAGTEDLLAGSGLPFAGGAGISFAPVTPPWSAPASHGEWEFPLVLRYFSDGAATNQSGDRFEFRVVTGSGVPVAAAQWPAVTLEVPEGHLGGTFVETPGRLGPWQGADGGLYFLMEPAETDNKMMIVRSTDGGRSWAEVDGAHRPGTGDLEGVATAFDGERIHILHQTSDDVLYHVFRTRSAEAPAGWERRDEHLASPTEPPVQVADLALRSDGSVVGVYGDLHRVLYRIRSPEGEWGAVQVVESAEPRDLSGPVLVRGRDDVVHLAYTGSDGTAWYRRIMPDGSLTAAQLVARGLGTAVEDAGGILPLVYLPDEDMVSIIYRLDSGELRERVAGSGLTEVARVTDRAVARNAADSEQVGADAVAFGDEVHVLFIEARSGRLYHTQRSAGGTWAEPVVVVDGENVLWVRGAVIRRPGEQPVYGFVYDGGSGGGSGLNRYREVPL